MKAPKVMAKSYQIPKGDYRIDREVCKKVNGAVRFIVKTYNPHDFLSVNELGLL
jgi:hypothetical protein